MGLNNIKRVILPIQLSLSIENQILIFKILLQIYQVILIYGIFSGLFLVNLKKFSLNTEHNFAKSRVISKCKNNKPSKN